MRSQEELELGEDSDDEQDAYSGEEIWEESAGRTREEGRVSSMADISRAICEVKTYCERSQVCNAICHLRFAKANLLSLLKRTGQSP